MDMSGCDEPLASQGSLMRCLDNYSYLVKHGNAHIFKMFSLLFAWYIQASSALMISCVPAQNSKS